MLRGAWIPIRTFSPMIDSTDTSMSSPIMMLWFDLRVRTSKGVLASLQGWAPRRAPNLTSKGRAAQQPNGRTQPIFRAVPKFGAVRSPVGEKEAAFRVVQELPLLCEGIQSGAGEQTLTRGRAAHREGEP